MLAMDLFDRQILVVLRDGKPRKFEELLQEVRFSHNTLRLHLSRLEREGFIVKTKKPKNGPGRSTLTYSLPPKLRRQVDLTVTEPYTTIVSLTFQKLRHLCRFEKGRYCKKTRRRCEAQSCPQILKRE